MRAFRSIVIVAMVAVLAPPVCAHVTMGTPTLRQLAQAADVVVRARVVDADAAVTATDPPLRRPAVEIEILEIVDGTLVEGRVGGRLRIVQHGHGVPAFTNGEEVLLFLQRLERVPELAHTRLAGRVTYVSQQESDSTFVLTPPRRANLITAVRAYAAVGALDAGRSRLDGLRRLTVKLLASNDRWLAASALRDLVLMSDAPVVVASDVPGLVAIVDDRTRPMGFRVGLLAELERRALVDGPSSWVRLLRSTSGVDADRLVVLRAVTAHPSDAVSAELLAILAARRSTEITAAAAVALGTPGNDVAVPALTKALGDDDRRVRSGAIRGLGRIATPAAREAIELAAAFQPDGDTRRRARAEITVLNGGARKERE